MRILYGYVLQQIKFYILSLHEQFNQLAVITIIFLVITITIIIIIAKIVIATTMTQINFKNAIVMKKVCSTLG